MAYPYLKTVYHKDGTKTHWIIDRREGRMISISASEIESQANAELERYLIRRELEKEGYDDRYTSHQNALIDQVCDPQTKKKEQHHD